MTTLTATVSDRSTRGTARMLTWSPLLFIAVVVLFTTAVARSGVEDSADITPAILDKVGALWPLLWLTLAAAQVFGSIGMIRLSRWLATDDDSTTALLARLTAVAAAVTIGAALVGGAFGISLMAADDFVRMGDLVQYDAQYVVNFVAIASAYVTIACAGAALHRSRRLRRTGLVVAIIATTALVVDLVSGGMVPPFVMALLWCGIGVALLRRRVPSDG
jgi:hypothetical protein